jgi:hypothetical protein
MENTNLDRILGSEEELAPSSGFLASVMERVREEAAAPPPIPFPWKRAVPGMVLAVGVLGWSGVELLRRGLPALQQVAMLRPQVIVTLTQPMEQAGWVALALGISLLSLLLARRVAR